MAISAQIDDGSAVILSASLVNKIQIGDQKAEAEFAAACSNHLLLVLRNCTQNPDIALDCCQKTLLITLKKIRAGDIRKPESILAFLSRTAKNVVITHHRAENRYKNLGVNVCHLPDQMDRTVAREIDSEIIKCLLQKLLHQLSIPRDREILQRFYLNEESKSSICWDFGIKPEHFDRVLYRAKQRVRLMLEKQEDVRRVLCDCLGESKFQTRKPKCQNRH